MSIFMSINTIYAFIRFALPIRVLHTYASLCIVIVVEDLARVLDSKHNEGSRRHRSFRDTGGSVRSLDVGDENKFQL